MLAGGAIAVVVAALLLLIWRRMQQRVTEVAPLLISVKAEGAKLQSLRPDELGEAAECMAAAFEDSPFWAFIAGPEADTSAKRRALMSFVFERNMLAVLSRDPHAVLGLRDDRGFACVFMLCSPAARHLSTWAKVRAGLLELPFRFGMGPMKRLLTVAAWVDSSEQEAVGDSRHASWQVQRMAVAPRCQGKGLGSACLTAALETRVPKGERIVLSTNLDRNVVFYKRLGFALVADQTAPPSAGSVRSWTLTH